MRHSRVVGLVAVLSLGAFCGFHLYFHTGIVHVTRKPGSTFQGCICHDFTASPNVSVWIEGPDTLPAGEYGTFMLSLAKDSSIAGGFNIATFYGMFGIVDSAETDTLEGEMTHTFPKPAAGRDTISWLFQYRAPMTPGITDTIYSVANSVNLNLDPSGDSWNFGDNFLVRVTGSTGVEPVLRAQTYRLMQNYPNPFNPSTTIRYELGSASEVRLQVYDISGRLVRELVHGRQPAGIHEALFDVTGGPALASGMYFCRLDATDTDATSGRRFQEVRKMLYVR